MNIRKGWLVTWLAGMISLMVLPAAVRAANEGHRVRWTAEWIWPSPSAIAPHKNQFVLFRKTFTLAALPSQARLEIFADSRYRLYVNGAYIGQGPARAPHGWYYYDVFHVASKLRQGLNVIAVEVRWYGQGMAWYVAPPAPVDHGALLCQLEVGQSAGQQIIGSDASWRATEDHAWDWNTPELNALGNIEVYHADRVVKGWTEPQFDASGWIPVTVIKSNWGLTSPPEEPYTHLVPRPMAYPVEREVAPAKVAEAGVFPARPQPGSSVQDRSKYLAGLGKAIASEKHQPEPSILRDGAALTSPSASAYAEVEPDAAGQTPYVILDMGREVDGYLQFSVESPKPALIDVGWSEMMQHEDITADQPGGNYVAQYFVAPGSQHWTMWGWHGMRFVELSFPGLAAPLRFHVNMRFSTAKLSHAGTFESSSPLLNKLWQMGAYTFQLCSLDGTMDCPTREQRQWLGDGEVELRVNGVANGNTDIAQKFLLDASRDEWRNGAVPMVSDSGEDFRVLIDDYIFSFVNALREYYLETGDKDFVLRLYPGVVRAMMWFQPLRRPDGLLGPVPYWVFLDWSNPDKKGESSILNALYAHTLENAAKMADLAGDRYHAQIFRNDAARVHAIFNERFWDPGRGLYVDAWNDGHQSKRLGQLANADAILYGFAPKDRIPALLAKMTDATRLETNDASHGPRQDIVQAQTYGMFFVLNVLAHQGDASQVRDIIEKLWGPMAAAGNDTFWENFNKSGTLCHAWSAAPTYFLTTLILGVRPVRPGYLEYKMAPHPAGLEWAKGTVPTVHGSIRVDWKWEKSAEPGTADRDRERFNLKLRNPSGESAHVILPDFNGGRPTTVTLDGKVVTEPILIRSAGEHTVEAHYD